MTERQHAEDGAETRPVVKLRPKGGKRLRAGAPWVYADEIAMDRRARKIAPGTVVELVDAERSPLGAFAFNPDSTIAARLLDPDPRAEIGRDWLAARLRHALDLRARLFDAPFYRLVHAEADGLPGLVVDRFGAVAVVQPNAAWADRRADRVADALVEVCGVSTVVINGGSRARTLEGLVARMETPVGGLDGPVPVPMNGATYIADLEGGQKTGLFYDQRPNHAFAQRLASGADVLDVFAHVGGFALAALVAGARQAVAVDSSAPALELAAEGARRSGVARQLETIRADAFDAMRDLGEDGAAFDLVVCDPPAFAPTRQALQAGLRAYEKTARLAAALVRPGGFLTLCSCSHAADAESFHRACVSGLRKAGRSGALIHSGRAGPDHPVHMALPETSYLKALFFRLD